MTKNKFSPEVKIGVLGGGQLGRMLIQEAINLNLSLSILDSDPAAPASAYAEPFVNGSITDFETVYQFGKGKDLLTIEIENVNVDALEKLEQEGVSVYPQPKLIRLIQDKGLQKEFYRNNGIPTADFRLVDNRSDLTRHRDFLPFAQKLRKGGYDGKGVVIHKQELQFDQGFDAPSVLEKFVDFEKELAVIVARSVSGEVKAFPVVEQQFNTEANLVEFLFSPANIDLDIEQKAREIACTIIEKLELVGLLAVEFFLTKSGDLLVNEVAPRPHNSGHQTIEGNYTSQFEQHLRAITNLPLGNTDQIMPAVMVNLLGAKGYTGKATYVGMDEILAWSGVYPHLYGKKETKPFRKMGHITVTHPSLEAAKKIARDVLNTLVIRSSDEA